MHRSKLSFYSNQFRGAPQLQDAALSAQKSEGSKRPGASGGSVKRALKHRAWQLHTCHLPASVSTVTWQGSTPVDSMSHPQKQHGPNFTESSS